MKTVTVKDFENDSDTLLNSINGSDRLILKSGNKKFVLMRMDEYNSLAETLHLFSTPANAMHLIDSLKQARGLEKSNDTI